MVNTPLKNTIFCISYIVLLYASILHNNLLIYEYDLSSDVYKFPFIAIIATCLFAYLCLFIFAMLILCNLNDFILNRCLNLIGAFQKLRIVSESFLI